jgi:hypothetical protein
MSKAGQRLLLLMRMRQPDLLQLRSALHYALVADKRLLQQGYIAAGSLLQVTQPHVRAQQWQQQLLLQWVLLLLLLLDAAAGPSSSS